MNILFYVEPWIEKDWPSWKDHWLPQLEACVQALNGVSNHHRFLFVLGDAQKDAAANMAKYSNAQFVEVSQKELKTVFPDYSQALDSWYRGTFNETHVEKMCAILKDKIGTFVPDLIWTFMSPVPFMKSIFPGVTVLHQEVGALTGGMYPKSWFLDPSGVFRNSFPGRFSQELVSLPSTPEGNAFLDSLRTVLRKSMQPHIPFTREMLLEGRNCEYLVFFPLQYNGHFGTDSHCRLPSQFDIICHILDNLDTRVGLVVSEHVNPVGKRVLNSETISYLQRTYSNFIFKKNLRRYPRASQFLIDMSDAVISVSSTMGLQALFWEKALFVVGDSHLAGLSHGTDLRKIYEVLKSSRSSRNGALYHLLTHYYFLHTPYVSDGRWLSEFLQKSCQLQGRPADFAFFERIDSDETLLRHYQEQIRRIDDPPVLDEVYVEDQGDVLLERIIALQQELSVVRASEQLKIQELQNIYDSKFWKWTSGLRSLMVWIQGGEN